MKTAFSFISRTLAALFSCAVILAIPISQLFFHTGRVIFNHETMRKIGQETVRELDLPSQIVQHVTGKVDGEPAWPWEDPALKKLILKLEDGEQERLLRAALPQQVIRLWAGQVIDSLYQWLDSERALPRLTLDTRLIREQITGSEGEKMADLLFESLPPCTARDLATALTSLDDLASPEMILDLACKLPLLPREEQVEVYAFILERIAGEVPQEVNLVRELQGNEEAAQGGIKYLKRGLRVARRGWGIALLAPVAGLLLVALFGVRSWAGLGGWWGTPVFLGNGLSLAGTFVYPRLLTRIITGQAFSGAPAFLQPLLIRALQKLSIAIIRPLRWHASAGLAAGTVLLAVMVIAKAHRRIAVPPTSSNAEEIL